MKIISWISSDNKFAQKPLLGKTSTEYVLEALNEFSQVIEGNALPQSFDIALIVRADAPALMSVTLEGLCHAVLEHDGQPCVLLARDMENALAIALSEKTAKALMQDESQLMSVFEIVGRLNDQMIGPRCWQDEMTDTCFAVTNAASYAEAFRFINQNNIALHQENGVIILEPERTIIEDDVTIGEGTMIYAGNTLEGRTVIGQDCVLYPNNRMNNAKVGDGVTIESSVLLDCSVGNGTTVGPYAYIRPNSHVGEDCRIGDFVEIKNSEIGNQTKISHLTYVGDSDLGERINLGCGVVFVNYDGKTKNRSKIEDDAFIGCNCNLIAPVHVGKHAYLAAGSTVVEDVPEDSMLVARSRAVIKKDWVKRRRESGKL
ncbi:MAG: hypothetical protein GX096_13830 [Clostridiales bacterium]|nr:hypothetical protein [Clostridiales bacterium]